MECSIHQWASKTMGFSGFNGNLCCKWLFPTPVTYAAWSNFSDTFLDKVMVDHWRPVSCPNMKCSGLAHCCIKLISYNDWGKVPAGNSHLHTHWPSRKRAAYAWNVLHAPYCKTYKTFYRLFWHLNLAGSDHLVLPPVFKFCHGCVASNAPARHSSLIS